MNRVQTQGKLHQLRIELYEAYDASDEERIHMLSQMIDGLQIMYIKEQNDWWQNAG